MGGRRDDEEVLAMITKEMAPSIEFLPVRERGQEKSCTLNPLEGKI